MSRCPETVFANVSDFQRFSYIDHKCCRGLSTGLQGACVTGKRIECRRFGKTQWIQLNNSKEHIYRGLRSSRSPPRDRRHSTCRCIVRERRKPCKLRSTEGPAKKVDESRTWGSIHNKAAGKALPPWCEQGQERFELVNIRRRNCVSSLDLSQLSLQ